MNLQLLDKVVLITGGAKGIGAATAHAFAREGAVPVIVDRDVEAGEKLGSELRRDGAQFAVISTDVASAENCLTAVEQTVQEL